MNAVTDYLFIGSLRDSYERNLLRDRGVDAIIQLAEKVEHPDIPCFYQPLTDGKPVPDAKLDAMIDFIRKRKSEHRATLVACGLGISRSATVAIATVKEIECISLSSALLAVRSRHPEARPHPVLWQCLCDRYSEAIPYLAVIRKPEVSDWPPQSVPDQGFPAGNT